MASFQAKIGWKTQRNENKSFRFVLFRSYSTRNRKFKKNSKIPLWKMPRKREYKNYRYVSFPPHA